MNNTKKIIIPSAFFQIGEFITINNGEVVLSPGDIPIMKCMDLSGEPLFIKFKIFRSKDELTTANLIKFFSDKQKQMITEKEILKIKNYLEDSPAIEEEIDSLSLSRKDERVWLKDKANSIAMNNWEISSGKWMRGSLSYTSEIIKFNDKEYQLLESHSIIYENDNEPSKSGLYYITKNRHNIPLIASNVESGGSIFLNKNIASIDNFTSLLRHAIRTAKKKIDFLPEFSTRLEEWTGFCNGINKYKIDKNYSRYIAGCEFLLDNLENDIMNKIFIKLPKSLMKSFKVDMVKSDSNSMLNTLKSGVQRIYYPKISELDIDDLHNVFYSELNPQSRTNTNVPEPGNNQIETMHNSDTPRPKGQSGHIGPCTTTHRLSESLGS